MKTFLIIIGVLILYFLIGSFACGLIGYKSPEFFSDRDDELLFIIIWPLFLIIYCIIAFTESPVMAIFNPFIITQKLGKKLGEKIWNSKK